MYGFFSSSVVVMSIDSMEVEGFFISVLGS